jgi:Domain of unknown function (DUF4907)
MGFWRKWGLSILMIIVIIGTFSYGFYRRSQFRKSHSLVDVRVFPVKDGWGYDVLRDGHPYFHQDFIPSVGGHRVFRSKEDALAVGKLVEQHIMSGQLPSVTEKEIRDLNVYIPADTSRVTDSLNTIQAAKQRDTTKKSK